MARKCLRVTVIVSQGKYVSKLERAAYVVPSISSVKRPEGYDTDKDGMPDLWETLNGYNKNIDDSAEDRDGDGYTNIEEFLNRTLD